MSEELTDDEKKFLKVRAEKIERMRRIRKARKKSKRRKWSEAMKKNKPFRALASDIQNYSDIVTRFMPKNLAYLISYDKSPVHMEWIEMSPSSSVKIVRLPEVFSILENPKGSYERIREIVEALVEQKCRTLWIDYGKCLQSDLVTQLFLDTILRDWIIFEKQCLKAGLGRYMKIESVGGRNYDNVRIQKMVDSVGSPAIILNKQTEDASIVPFKLRYMDRDDEDVSKSGTNNEVDLTRLLDYVSSCLERVGKRLTPEAMDALGIAAGEMVINASEHSTLHSRYLVGYFEDLSYDGDENTHGLLHLVILNYGQSIYECFKYPSDPDKINTEAVRQMKQLSDEYTTKGFFSADRMKESTLWTLYALQDGVTIVPDQKRGSGTISFIRNFFNLRESDDDNDSRMYIMSGNTVVVFDGKYEPTLIADSDGTNRFVMAFNESGTLKEKPDPEYVRYTRYFFPGTAIYAKIALNTKILTDE